MLILQTQRLALRELTPDDLDFVAEMVADPEVMRHYPKVLDRRGAQEWLDRQRGRYQQYGHGLWLVELRDNGQPVGQVGLSMQEIEGEPWPEVGYLIHRPYWRRGYASEAALAVRDHAFTSLDKNEVVSLIRPDNLPSQAVARKLGMKMTREVEFAGLPHLMFSVRRTHG